MAVILKKPAVDDSGKKKIDYHGNPVSVEPSVPVIEPEAVLETPIESLDEMEQIEPELEQLVVAQEDDYIHLDGKIIHQGVTYLSEAAVEELITQRIAAEQEDIAKAAQEQVETAKQQGYEAGCEQGITLYEEQQAELTELVENINKAFETQIHDNMAILQEAVFVGLTRVLGERLSLLDERMAAIKTVINDVATSNPFVLRLSEQDYAALQQNEELRNTLNAERIVSDNRVAVGGCIIETDKGIFDGRLEVQLARLKETIGTEVDE